MRNRVLESLGLLVIALLFSTSLASALSATVYLRATDTFARQSAAIGSSTSVQWKGTLSPVSTGECYFDLKFGSTSAATSVWASRRLIPGTSFPYTTHTSGSRYFWRAQMNTPGIADGRVGSSTVYIP